MLQRSDFDGFECQACGHLSQKHLRYMGPCLQCAMECNEQAEAHLHCATFQPKDEDGDKIAELLTASANAFRERLLNDRRN